MKGNFAEQKSYRFKNFEKLEVQNFFVKITAGRTVFIFFHTYTVYSLCITIHICEGKFCRKVEWV